MLCVQEVAPADFGSGGIEDQSRQISMLWTVTVPKRRKLHLLTAVGCAALYFTVLEDDSLTLLMLV